MTFSKTSLNFVLPTLISNGFNRSPQQSPRLTMYTSFTGSTCSKSTLHHGFISSRLCIQEDSIKAVWLSPSTALLLGLESDVLIIFVGLPNARFSKKRNKKHVEKCFKNLADRVLSLHTGNKVKDICKNINFCWL